jgi:Tol biopolymer transport system component
MAAILKEDPPDPLPSNVPPALARIVSRCLEKSRDTRFQSARDLAFGLEVLSDTGATAVSATSEKAPRRWQMVLGAAVVVLSLLAAVAGWLTRRTEPTPPPVENPLADARFSRLTDWEGTESAAEISPDGKFVVFLADRDGQRDLFLSQVGTGSFQNLTKDIPSLRTPGVILRNYGFSGDGAEIWFSFTGDPGEPKVLLPLTGGTPRPFLDKGYNSPSWSPDGSRLAYFVNGDGDPLFVADRSGADPSPILAPGNDAGFFAKGMHSHNPIWSTDGEWIYFVHGLEPTEDMDVWRARRSGESLERLTAEHTAINFLAALDPHTLLYVARAPDRSGPWLWSLDVERKVARRVTSGLEQYSYISASRDGRRVVASVANPTVSLLRVPIGGRPAEDSDVQPYQLPTPRALAPRFGGTTLFYLSARGTADGLWRFQNGQASEVWKAVDGGLSEPAAVSADGNRVAVLTRRDGRRTLAIMSADGTNSRTLTTSIDIQGAGGQGAADWSPDGAWIVVAGSDAQGPGVFKIPVDGGPPVRLVSGQAVNPVWSPDGNLIVYGGTLVTGQVPLLGVRPDGTPVELPPVQIRLGGNHRFLPNGTGLVYVPSNQNGNFWLLDLGTKQSRPLTRLSDRGSLHTFDVTPDGKEIVFDRTRENSDIYLIDLPVSR